MKTGGGMKGDRTTQSYGTNMVDAINYRLHTKYFRNIEEEMKILRKSRESFTKYVALEQKPVSSKENNMYKV